MKCSDCKRWRTSECYLNPQAADLDNAEQLTCFKQKKDEAPPSQDAEHEVSRLDEGAPEMASDVTMNRQPLSLIIILPLAFGFFLGIVPGLLLGLIDGHNVGAIVIPIIWTIGYVMQRGSKYKDVNWVTFCIAIFGGVGLGFSIWVFGNITS